MKRISKARALLDAQEAAALREAQRIRLWEQFGYTSLVDYMQRELGYTARTAVERLRVANAIEELPAVEAALEQGALSFSGARELTRIVTPETQAAWLDAAQDKNVRQIEEMVSGHKPGDLPSDPVDEQLRTKVLRFEVKLDSAALVRDYQKKRAKELGCLVDDDLLIREVFQIALDRLVARRREDHRAAAHRAAAHRVVDPPHVDPPHVDPPHEDQPHVDPPHVDQLCEDQPHEDQPREDQPHEDQRYVDEPCEDRSAAEEVAARVERRSEVAIARPRYQFSVSVCDDCKRGWLNTAGTSTLLAPPELATALCDSEEIGRVDYAGPVVRKRTSIPPARKRKVLARDRYCCQVPGCRSTNIDVHHLHALELGGSHDEWNLVTLCEAHHLAIHRGTLVATGRAPGVTFTFAAANRFAVEARVVETKRELARRGFARAVAAAAVNAVRTHVGTQPLSREDWLKLAVAECAKQSR